MPHHDLKFPDGITRRIILEDEDVRQVPKCAKEILVDQVYTTPEVQINKGDTVIDGGAYVGVFSLYALALGAAKVIAFEPSPRKYELMRATRKENGIPSEKWKIYNIALWHADQRLRFRVHNRGPMSSLVVDREIKATRIVDGRALDDIPFSPDFVKLDIEGAEIPAIVGMAKILTTRPKLAISLYHKDNDMLMIPEILKRLGYGDPVAIKGGTRFKVGVWDRAKD